MELQELHSYICRQKEALAYGLIDKIIDKR